MARGWEACVWGPCEEWSPWEGMAWSLLSQHLEKEGGGGDVVRWRAAGRHLKGKLATSV